MEYLQGFIIVTVLLTLYFFLGDWVGQLFHAKSGVVSSVVIGFAATLAVFELLALPFLFLDGRFTWLYVLTLLIIGAGVCWSVFRFLREKRYRCYGKPKIGGVSGFLLLIAVAGIVFFQAFCSSYYQHEDADDSYFIAISNIALEQDQVVTDEEYVCCGHELFPKGIRPGVSSWELYIAVLSRIFGVKPAGMAHSFLPFLLILMCYFSYHMLAVNLLEDVRKQRVFLLVIGILNLFGGISIYSVSTFLLIRIWQGKAMLCNFLFPLVYAGFADIYQRGLKQKSQWIGLVGFGILGVAFSVVGIFLIPILIFTLLASYLIYLRAEHQPGIGQILKKVAMLALPVSIILLLLFLKVVCSTSGRSYIAAMGQGADWLADYNKIFGMPFYRNIAIASVVLLWFIRKRGKKFVFLFLGSTLILFGTFLNPLLCGLISVYVTGVAVYWRLYWLVPVLPLCGVVVAELIMEKKKYVLLAIDLSIIGISIWQSDGYIYQEERYFTESSGAMKLYPGTCAVIEYLEEQEGFHGQMVVGPEWITYQVRQYTSLVVVPRPRDMASFYISLGRDLFPYNYDHLYRDIYGNHDISSENAQKGLEYLGVEYIFTGEELCTGTTPYACVAQREGIYIYKKQGRKGE